MAKNSQSYGRNTVTYYDEHAAEFFGATAGEDFRAVYVPFVKELPARASILDAGCGSGRDTKAFLDMGFKVTAIDASSRMAALASGNCGRRCEVMEFREMAFEERFDGIWACASLLHVPTDQMYKIMGRFVTALKVGAVMYVSLKEGTGEGIVKDGRFFSFYTVRRFRMVVTSMPAWKEIGFWRTGEVRSVREKRPWLNFLVKRVS
jgi:SAM-dependent methyltransferase